ncbi:hypothetical protein ACIPJQ_10415 [Streptomyces griseoviridis]
MASNIEQYSLRDDVKPHSVAIGSDNWIYVSSSNGRLVRFPPGSPTSQEKISQSIFPQHSAGIVADPYARAQMWFASPAQANDYDPIYSVGTRSPFPLTQYGLEADARAEWLVPVQRKVPDGQGGEKVEWDIVFAEPKYSYVGILPLYGNGPAGDIKKLPTLAGFNTWLYAVAVTSDASGKRTYWVTGQANTKEGRTTNALFHLKEGGDAQWVKEDMDGPPYYILADSESVYLTTHGVPRKIGRLKDNLWNWRDLDHLPYQMTFTAGAKGSICIAAHGAICEVSLELDHSLSDPIPGGVAVGICAGAESGKVWFTNQWQKKIGSYTPVLSKNTGRVRVVKQRVETVPPHSEIPTPVISAFFAGSRPVPGIPLTYRLSGAASTFLTGKRETVQVTDHNGEAPAPSFMTGAKGKIQLDVSYGSEPPVSVTFAVK